MSRSKKKVPAYKNYDKWIVACRRANKRSERRAVKDALKKEDWDTMPHPKELGKRLWGGKSVVIRDPGYFRDMAVQTRKIYKDASLKSSYVLEELVGRPYDFERERWQLLGQIGPNDENLSWSYSEVYNQLHTWFPIHNRYPVDPNWCDESYIKDYFMRK